jgi:hypothetical protein
MNEGEKRKLLEKAMIAKMRDLGVEFRDDLGERIKPGSFQELRLIGIIVRVQCQSLPVESAS